MLFRSRASGNARSVDPRELNRRFAEISGKMSQVAPNLKEAMNLAARAVQREDLICVTGSFYLAGEAKRLLLEKAAQRGIVQVEQAAMAEMKPVPKAIPKTRA